MESSEFRLMAGNMAGIGMFDFFFEVIMGARVERVLTTRVEWVFGLSVVI